MKSDLERLATMSHLELVGYLAARSGAVILGVETLTDAKARKNPLGTIFKRSRSAAVTGASYQKAVRTEGERQGVVANFTASSLPWGHWVVANKIIKYQGELYLRLESTPKQHKQRKVLDYRNSLGQIVSSSAIKEFLPEKRESRKQQEAGLSETIQVRTIKLSSILRVRIGGKTYKLIANDSK